MKANIVTKKKVIDKTSPISLLPIRDKIFQNLTYKEIVTFLLTINQSHQISLGLNLLPLMLTSFHPTIMKFKNLWIMEWRLEAYFWVY